MADETIAVNEVVSVSVPMSGADMKKRLDELKKAKELEQPAQEGTK